MYIQFYFIEVTVFKGKHYIGGLVFPSEMITQLKRSKNLDPYHLINVLNYVPNFQDVVGHFG